MPRYVVTVIEAVRFRVQVDADDEHAARDVAIERVIEEGDDAGFFAVDDRSAYEVAEVAT